MGKQSDGRRWGRLKKYGISAEEHKQKIEAGFLWCCFCKQFLTSDKFSAYQIRKEFSTRCSECDRARSKKWQSEHSELHKARMRVYYKDNAEALRKYARDRWESIPAEQRKDHHRRWALRSRFGLTPKQYDALLEKQNGVCAICGKAPNGGRQFPVDHDHACCPHRKSCGKCIRGILCERCNALVGFLEKFKDLIPACEAYLARAFTSAN